MAALQGIELENCGFARFLARLLLNSAVFGRTIPKNKVMTLGAKTSWARNCCHELILPLNVPGIHEDRTKLG